MRSHKRPLTGGPAAHYALRFLVGKEKWATSHAIVLCGPCPCRRPIQLGFAAVCQRHVRELTVCGARSRLTTARLIVEVLHIIAFGHWPHHAASDIVGCDSLSPVAKQGDDRQARASLGSWPKKKRVVGGVAHRSRRRCLSAPSTRPLGGLLLL